MLAGLAMSAIGGVFLLGIVIYISYDLPQLNSLSDYSPPIPSKIYSKDGFLLMELSREKRELATIEEIPQKVIDTFLAAEDDNFYNHTGIDYKGIMRAMLINIKAGRIVQGASTITQQVAKSLLLSNERTFTRKIKDLILAKKIEEKLSKEEILFLYLNQVYLGGGYYGVKSAFRGYFDKELSEATTAEMALVAGLLVAPGKYSPYVNPDMAKKRQRYVLGRLYKTEKISKEEYDAAIAEPIKIQIRKGTPFKAGYFTDWIRQRLIKHFGKEDFLTNGYEVVTTLDWSLQEKAEVEVLNGVKEMDKRQGYKGVLGHLDSKEEINEFISKQRDEVYMKASNYLIFRADGTTEKEFQPLDDEYLQLVERETEIFSETKIRGKVFLELGNAAELNKKFLEFVDFSTSVKAVVTKVSNLQRAIYANYAGMKILIPYENFKWAHERKIQEERHYWGYLTRPETVFKPGDIILVKIDNKSVSPMNYIWSDFKKAYGSNKDLMAEIKKQKFHLGHLEQEPDAQGALLSISPQTGEIISMVGGSDFSKSQFNRVVQSNRQPGSAFKPLIFAAGLESNYTPSSILLDSPAALGGVDSSLSWKPRNYDGKFKGTMTFRRALETSRNIPTIKLTQDIGVEKIVNFVDRLGVKASLPPDLSVSLGSFGLNLLDIVGMYSIFPNGGRKTKLKSILSIKDRYGRVHHITSDDEATEEDKDKSTDGDKALVPSEELATAKAKVEEPKLDETLDEEDEVVNENPYLATLDENQVYDARLAYIMSNLLKGVIKRGTGRGTSDISSYIGGKTGTTNNYVDSWFIGFSPKVVTGVWTGFDNNQTLGFGETGAKSALPIWRSYMKLAIRKFGDTDFPIPSGIVNIAVNPDTGMLYQDGPKRLVEAFVDGTGPGSENSVTGDDSEDAASSILDGEDYYNAQ